MAKANNSSKEVKQHGNLERALVVVAVVVILGLVIGYSDIDEAIAFREWMFPPPPPPPPPKSDVELGRFSTLSTNTSLNVEIEITNIGDDTAKDISIFVRITDQGGTLLYSSDISLTVVLLESGESCTGYYAATLTGNETKVFQTIEISWEDGRKTYHKETPL